MSFSREHFESSPPPKYYPNDDVKIREIVKEEILALMKDEEFFLAIKEKLKAEIKDEVLLEIKLKQKE